MFRGLGNLATLVKSAQEFQAKLASLQRTLREQRVQGTAGGGLITVEANGLGDVLKVTIAPNLIENKDRELIEDLLPAAINQAVAKARERYAEEMRSLTAGLQLPGLDSTLAQLVAGTPPTQG